MIGILATWQELCCNLTQFSHISKQSEDLLLLNTIYAAIYNKTANRKADSWIRSLHYLLKNFPIQLQQIIDVYIVAGIISYCSQGRQLQAMRTGPMVADGRESQTPYWQQAVYDSPTWVTSMSYTGPIQNLHRTYRWPALDSTCTAMESILKSVNLLMQGNMPV